MADDGVNIPTALCNGIPQPGTVAAVCNVGCATQGFTQPGPICGCFGVQVPRRDGSCGACPSDFNLPLGGTAPQDCTPTTFVRDPFISPRYAYTGAGTSRMIPADASRTACDRSGLPPATSLVSRMPTSPARPPSSTRQWRTWRPSAGLVSSATCFCSRLPRTSSLAATRSAMACGSECRYGRRCRDEPRPASGRVPLDQSIQALGQARDGLRKSEELDASPCRAFSVVVSRA